MPTLFKFLRTKAGLGCILLICAWTASPLYASETEKSLDYEVAWQSLDKPYAYLNVTLTFQGEANGQTRIRLPKYFAGNNQLYQQIHNLRVEEGHIEDEKKPYNKIIHHSPNAKIVLHYQVRPTQTTTPYFTHDVRQALIFKDYMHFVSTMVLVVPYKPGTDKYQVRMQWKLPEGWKLYSSISEGVNQFEAKLTLEQFQRLLFVAGGYQIHKIKLPQQSLTLAIRGPVAFSKEALAAKLTSLYGEINKVFQTAIPSTMLISLTSLPKKSSALSGISMHQSMMITVSDQGKISRGLLNMLTHEYFHQWIKTRLFVDHQSSRRQFTWFVEGYTIYLTKIMLLKTGEYSYPSFVRSYNRLLERYFTSPAINLPNEQIYKAFSSSTYVHVLPDQRGRIMAHHLNAKIKQLYPKRHFGDYVVSLIMPRVKSDYTSHRLTWPYIFDHSQGFAEQGFEQLYQKYIIQGKTMPIHPMSLGPCALLSSDTLPELQPGLDITLSKKKGYLVGVEKDGPAYKVGLRNNERIRNIRWTRTSDMPIHQAPIIVELKEDQRTVHFLPNHIGDRIVPKFKVDDDKLSSSPESCIQWFF